MSHEKFPIAFLSKQFFEIPKRLSKVVRWSRWHSQGAEREDVLEHSFSQAFITIILAEMLLEEGKIYFSDAYEAISCSLIHDIGEAEYGDILDYEKKESDEQEERNFMRNLFESGAPGLSERLMYIFDIQDGAKDDSDIDKQKVSTLLFGASEKLCYFIYAARQKRVAPSSVISDDLWRHVYARQRDGLYARLHKLGLPIDNFSWIDEIGSSEESGEKVYATVRRIERASH